MHKRAGVRPSAVSPDVTVTPYATNGMYGPADLRSAYRIPASTTQATIALVDAYDAPTLESDLAVYRSHYGLPACTGLNGCLTKLNQYGAAAPLPPLDTDWSFETTLDAEMVSAACPTCHILIVEADSTTKADMMNAVRAATAAGAHYVSMSWGGDETSDETTDDQAYLSTPGVVYVAAAGDAGYGTSWPAAAPSVVSVGGTSLVRSTNARGWAEKIWAYTDGTGTGSGCSPVEAQPNWQAADATIRSVCGTHRAMNDLSVVADPNTGVAVYQSQPGQTNGWVLAGGTSAGSPLIAAMYAMSGTTAAAPALPYQRRQAFNDIADGHANTSACSTLGCYTAAGWDGPTGIGTPIGLYGVGGPSIVTVHTPVTTSSYSGNRVYFGVPASTTSGGSLSSTASGLPPGTAMTPSGFIYGTPTGWGAYTVTVKSTDNTGQTGTASFRWYVFLHQIRTSAVPHIVGSISPNAVAWAYWGSWRANTTTGAVIQPYAAVQWLLDGRPITGATASNLRISRAWRGHLLSFRLTASARYYANYSATSPALRLP